eukprot:COSAG06_NODE_66478_length_254_cov_0.670968_1_plen_80_part_01
MYAESPTASPNYTCQTGFIHTQSAAVCSGIADEISAHCAGNASEVPAACSGNAREIRSVCSGIATPPPPYTCDFDPETDG